jgi:phospholipid/cholesterol/gamma-HCH transport system permease protein
MHASEFHVESKGDRLRLSGHLTVANLHRAQQALVGQKAKGQRWQAIDISALETLDTSGAYWLTDLARDIPLAGASDEQRALLSLIANLQAAVPSAAPSRQPAFRAALIGIGKYMGNLSRESGRVITFMGQAVLALGAAIRRPHHLRMTSIVHHIEAIGIQALPIIGLIAFLIAIVLAYQGVAQLRPYGGEQFTVDLVAISILREMGVLLTAIMVAGRSGSAFTAEIGVMKANEEVDALKVMGIEPFEVLVVPRLIAIIIALPLLTFFANMLGIIGGYFITTALIDISLAEYLNRIHVSAQWHDFFVGMIKAPVFAFFIGLIGCMHGLRVTGSAESIGRETTTSVVKGIFIVLVLDAFFSILFQQVGI